MRAWQVQAAGEPVDVLHLVERPAPRPGPGEVQVRVAAAGIGLPDAFMCRGVYPLTPPLPFTPGQELCGVVSAVGDGVEHLPLGTRVMSTSGFVNGNGSFAEYTVVAAGQAFPVPSALDDAAAAGFYIPFVTAWIGLVDRGGLQPGEWLAVLGAAGGSGMAAVQLGKARGAKVVAVVSSKEKADLCRALGADVALIAGVEQIGEALRAATGGVDVIYDPVGGEPAEQAFRSLRRHGRLLSEGFASGRWPRIDTHLAVRANASLVGVYAGGYSRPELDEILVNLTGLLDLGHLRRTVERIDFAQLPEAVQRLADRQAVGKLALVVRR